MSSGAQFSRATGRGDESRPLWVLNSLPQEAAGDVEQWLDALAGLSLDAWLRIADRCSAPHQAPLPLTHACRRVERIIADQGLEFTAWLVRDFVETATYPARLAATRRPRGVRARVAVARMAAEWAALAKACRPWLSSDDHDLLCAPFLEPSTSMSAAI
ncbi:MAG TPA: hypothetical protein VL524_09740 [Gemmatimonadaceae bacterium]|jgi:hypothetical protein|nr:hypothetical protein [Gemmatimonadaceae bacterium]